MNKELSELQKKRQRGRNRELAERDMAKQREPRSGKTVARRIEKEKSELQHRDKAAEEFRRR